MIWRTTTSLIIYLILLPQLRAESVCINHERGQFCLPLESQYPTETNPFIANSGSNSGVSFNWTLPQLPAPPSPKFEYDSRTGSYAIRTNGMFDSSQVKSGGNPFERSIELYRQGPQTSEQRQEFSIRYEPPLAPYD